MYTKIYSHNLLSSDGVLPLVGVYVGGNPRDALFTETDYRCLISTFTHAHTHVHVHACVQPGRLVEAKMIYSQPCLMDCFGT